MADILSDIDKVLQNEIVERHTFYQLKFFVLGSEPTIQAKLQCCLRELKSRRLQLESLGREMDELSDQNIAFQAEADRIAAEQPTDENGIDLLGDAVEQFEQEREVELRGVRRRLSHNTRQLVELQRKFKYVTEECQFFVTAFRQLEQEEKIKPWDDLEVQKEYWDAKLGQEFRTRLILGQPLDHELVKAIGQLHDDAPTKQAVLQLMQKQEEFNRQHGLPMPEGTVAIEQGVNEEAAQKGGLRPMQFPEGVLETLGAVDRVKA